MMCWRPGLTKSGGTTRKPLRAYARDIPISVRDESNLLNWSSRISAFGMAFRVEFTARAKRDLDNTLDWLLEEQADEAGIRWFGRLKSAIFSLDELPRR